MKVNLNPRFSAILILLAFCVPFLATASHMQGGEITYQAVSPNTYTVTLKLYRDCNGAQALNNASIKITSPNCNTGRTIPMTKVAGSLIGNPYCSQLGTPVCSATGKPNYEIVKYTTTITFSSIEQTCPDWYLSWTECCRASVANFVNATSSSLYLEAYLKLGLAVPNSSPEFNPLNVPMPIVCFSQTNYYNFNSTEEDGDSLLYELVAPLDSYNTPLVYAANPQNGTLNQLIVNPNPLPPHSQFQPQLAQLTGTIPATFNPTYPMPSLSINWGGPATIPYTGAPFTGMIWAAIPEFKFNQSTGALKFTPTRYLPNNTASNKYIVAVRISEFRKISGSWIKIGHIRRDMVFLVEDCGNNAGPGQIIQPITSTPSIVCGFDTTNRIPTCQTSRLRFKFTDMDGDNINITFDQSQINKLPNGRVRVIGQNQPNVTVEIDLTPGLADAGRKLSVCLKIEDDACPIKHSRLEVISLEVEPRNLVKVVGSTNRIICLGENAPINTTLHRPDSLLMQPATYNYTWSLADPLQAATAGLNPTDIHNKNIVVNPTQPGIYKYLVHVTPASISPTFAGCADTASVTIRVEENPNPAQITLSDPLTKVSISEISQGNSGQLDVLLLNSGTNYSYSWSPGKFLNDSTLKNPIASPLTTTTFTVKVKNLESDCVGELSREIQVVPLNVPNIITPNQDGKNDFFRVPVGAANTSLQIYNRLGRLLKDYPNYQNNFNGDGLSAGTYYYVIKEPNGVTHKGWLEIIR